MENKQIDWDEPWKVYDEYLPPKTTDQMIMFLMEEQLGLYHSDYYYVGVIENYDGYELNCHADTLYDALRGGMVKLYFCQEGKGIRIKFNSEQKDELSKYQEEFLERLKGY